jgi:tRNA/rRNA methyltransferase
MPFIRIILVEPAGALNLGSVARIMKNMDFDQLVLVNPRCDRHSPEARQMAVHANDILESAQEVSSLAEALQGCVKAIATTGNGDTTLPMPLESPRQVLPWLLPSNLSEPPNLSAIIFGREDSGLTTAELNYAHRLLLIPTGDRYTSLNLAQAVAICCYELYQMVHQVDQMTERMAIAPQIITPQLNPDVSSTEVSISQVSTSQTSTFATPEPKVPLETLEQYYQHLEALLLSIGYLHPHTAMSRMMKLRRLCNRAALSENDLALLRGMLRQIEWALRQNQSSRPNE